MNPLTSLNAPFRIPTLFVTTWRGRPGEPDEPQHEVMGQITQDLIGLMGLEQAAFPSDPAGLEDAFAYAVTRMGETELPFAWVMRKGDVADTPLDQPPASRPAPGRREDFTAGGARPARAAVLERFLALTDAATAVVATTGKCGRELFTLADRPQHLYQVGSMGGASGMALGVALNTPRRVVVLDGDGAALMKLGTFATIGACSPSNLIHILLDNGVHDSTGGQATVSASVDFRRRGARLRLPLRRHMRRAGRVRGGRGGRRSQPAARPCSTPASPRASMNRLGRPTVKPAEVGAAVQDLLGELTR